MSNRVSVQLGVKLNARAPYTFVLPDALDWQEQALCAETDPEAFFVERGGSTRAAKNVCRACPVREECLEYALTRKEAYGIWGGLSEGERSKLARQREAA